MNRDLTLTFSSERYIRCVFFSFVVKVTALEEKYPGGLKAYMEKHGARCNRDLSFMIAMGMEDLEDALIDAENNGIVPGEDAHLFDASMDSVYQPDGAKLYTGVDWLVGYSVDHHAMRVRLTESKKKQTPADQLRKLFKHDPELEKGVRVRIFPNPRRNKTEEVEPKEQSETLEDFFVEEIRKERPELTEEAIRKELDSL